MVPIHPIELAASTTKNRFELWSDFISRMQVTTAVEVGVFSGDFAQHILHNCPAVKKYYMIDPWRHLTNWNKPANKNDADFLKIKQKAIEQTQFAESRRVILEGQTSDVASEIPDNTIDFAYVDGDHTLRGITSDLIRMWPKIKDGGLLAGDDFSKSIWQHAPQFEPTFVFPMAVHFAEAMDCIIYGLPFNQFAIVVDRSSNQSFEFRDLTKSYNSTAVREMLQRRDVEYDKFGELYGDFNFEEDYRNYEITGLQKESKRIRGEIVKTLTDIPEIISNILLPGENNNVKNTYSEILNIDESQIITAGLNKNVDYHWNFEESTPDFGNFDCIVSQAMLEHLIDPYKHVRDLADALKSGGYLILHTVIPGFSYHRHPIDCVRFFPDWFEEVSKRLNLQVCDKYIGELRIMYKLRKTP